MTSRMAGLLVALAEMAMPRHRAELSLGESATFLSGSARIRHAISSPPRLKKRIALYRRSEVGVPASILGRTGGVDLVLAPDKQIAVSRFADSP